MIYIDSNNKLNLSKLHENQKLFVKSQKLNSGIVGGYQSGKSTAGSIKVITHLFRFPGVPIAYYLPNFRLFGDMLIPKFDELFEKIGLKYSHHQKDSKIITDLGEVWMRSMDTPETIVSYSVGYSLVDEIDRVHANKRKRAAQNIVARNSYRKTDAKGNEVPNQIDFVCTPEGFTYMYNFFVKGANERKVLFKLKTGANKDNLSSSYIDGLKEQYTENQLSAYLDGEFVNLTSGTVYHSFNRKINHSSREIKPNDKLHIGMDFNITNMSASIRVTDGNTSTAVDEITGAYDTAEMISILKQRYPKHHMTIYPDASGNARNTAGDSDIKLLKKAKFLVRVGTKNPSVRDRITTVNASFKNARGETTNFINTNNCPMMTEAYEQLAYKNGLPDKDSGFDHITDADGYCVFNLKTKTTTSINAG